MAGSNDFTGQNIQDTYQRVLQLSSSGQIADGTGSLVSLLPTTASIAVTASHALFAVSASHEVTLEISSSHAQNADNVPYSGLTGTVPTWNQDTTGTAANATSASHAQTASSANDGFLFRGDVTASGDISSSVFVRGHTFATRGKFFSTYDPGSDEIRLANATNNTRIYGATINLDANITSSGNISSSGTGINYFGGSVEIYNEGSPHIILNDTSNNVDFRIQQETSITEFDFSDHTSQDLHFASNTKNHHLVLDGGTGNVGIGKQGSNILSNLHIERDLTTDTHITASGNISSSGQIIGSSANFNDGNITNVGSIDVDQVRADADTSTLISLAATSISNTIGGANVVELTTKRIKLGVDANTHITASGNISGSNTTNLIIGGFISASSVTVDDLTINDDLTVVDDLSVGGALTVTGNITANGNIDGDGSTDITNMNDIFVDGVIHKADTDTKIEFDVDKMTFTVGGTAFLTLDQDEGTFEFGPAITSHITASKNISASSTSFIQAPTLKGDVNESTGLEVAGYISSSGAISTLSHITASGNISSSGHIVGASLNILSNTSALGYKISESSTDNLLFAAADGGGFTNISFKSEVTVQDEFFSADGMTHEGDTDTKITFGTDQITLTAGNVDMITLDENGNDILTFGNVQTKFEGHITASGDISASAGSILNVPLRHLNQKVQTSAGTQAQGDIYYAQIAVSTDAGKLYILQTNGNQALADKDTEIGATSLMGVAIGANSSTDGYLLRGMVKLHTDPFPGEGSLGSPAYLGDDGLATGSIAGHASDDYIRIIGHGISGSGTIYFNPDNTFIKKA